MDYVLWCLKSNRVYIGQTGARLNKRSVGKRGAEHIRLGSDFLRSCGEKVKIPSRVYRWMSSCSVENFVITPLEHVTPHSADEKEKEFMMKWGLDGLFNIDLPSPSTNKWLFLAD